MTSRSRLIRRVVAAAVLLAIAGFLAPAAGRAAAVRAAAPAPSWLHVEHPAGARPYIADSSGRFVLLRGANAAGLIDYWTGAVDNPVLFPVDPAAYDGACPQNSSSIEAPPLCEVDAQAPAVPADSSRDDIAQMRALGFDVVRLGLSWSLLEPAPGQYSTLYLDRIAQVVGWAQAQGLRVVLDMHQDAYSRYVSGTGLSEPPLFTSPRGYDGAPRWAVFTDGAPPVAIGGVRELDPAVQAAFTNFWLNHAVSGAPGAAGGTGLQDHYIGAVAALAQRFRDDSTVAGYEVMNEPSPGLIAPVLFEAGYLFPFYRRVIDAITGAGDGLPCTIGSSYSALCGYPDLGIHDRNHLVFVEPSILRDTLDVSTQFSAPFTSYGNVVFAPHVYTHALTLDKVTGLPIPIPISYDQAYQTGGLDATLLQAALYVTEFGDNPPDDATVLAQQLTAQDKAQVGSTVWVWKENCNDISPAQSWGVYDGIGASACQSPAGVPEAQNGALRPLRVSLLSRVWPRAVAGSLTGYTYDATTRAFTMTAASPSAVPAGDMTKETLVYVPAVVAGAVAVTGSATLDTIVSNPDGSRLVAVAPTGGAYRVAVG